VTATDEWVPVSAATPAPSSNDDWAPVAPAKKPPKTQPKPAASTAPKHDDWTPVQQTPTPQPSAGPGPNAPQNNTPSILDTLLAPIKGALSTASNDAASGLSTIAGHQDLMFILQHAAERDEYTNPKDKRGIRELLADPKSTTARAYQLWKTDPTAAMDEYGAGSNAQNQWAKQNHGDPTEAFRADHPIVNAAATFAEEMTNPISMLEGGAVGKVMDYLNDAFKTARTTKALGGAVAGAANTANKAAQGVAKATGFGSPLYEIANRGGTEGVNWVNGLLSVTQSPEKFLHVAPTEQLTQKIFGGLKPDEQAEVVALSQGLPVKPQYQSMLPQLQQRAKLLSDDIDNVTRQQVRTGQLKPAQARQNFFPMAGHDTYEFEIPPTVEANRTGTGTGYKRTGSKNKVFDNIRDAQASGKLDKNFLPANNYMAWRKSRLQQVGFEDMLSRAPQSLRLRANKGLRGALVRNKGVINGKEYRYYANPREVSSPQLRKGAWAPEVTDFLTKNDTLQKFISGGSAVIPGHENSWAQKFVGIARQMIVTNPGWHPIVNVARNASAARGMAGIPSTVAGVTPEMGGYLVESARAAAQQLGMNPKKFVGGAQAYSQWLDRALAAGATGEFGTPAKSAFGGDRARVLTVPPTNVAQRLDKAMTQLGSWNRNQVFGSKGEESFAVSLFKDASEHFQKGGASQHAADQQAAQITREALHDYYNWDPKSPWGYVDLFMPWRKGNTKFWGQVLTKKPQYVTGVSHAIRNYNEQTDPNFGDSPFPANDFQITNGPGGNPLTVAFPGKDIAPWANIAANKGGVLPNAQTALLGTANPIAKTGLAALNTAGQYFNSKDVVGPENSWNVLYNPKAPGHVQFQQAVGSLLGQMPVPLAGFALQDTMRRGLQPSDLMTAASTALSVGYVGGPKLTSTQRRQVSKAKQLYLKAFNRYQYDTHDDSALEAAWATYMDQLQNAGAVGR
jgi:hypothetical protein